MKKSALFALALLAVGAGFIACDDAKDEYHQQYFYPQYAYGMELYADQTADTVAFVSTDSWTARASEDWFTLAPESFTVPKGTIAKQNIYLSTAENLTGNIRSGRIEVDSYDKLGLRVVQYPWLNIQFPAYTRKSGSDFATDAEAIEFKYTILANTDKLPLLFTTYQDGATISVESDWLTLPDTIFAAGTHNFQPAIPQNDTKTARTALITITSGGISNQIQLTQEGKSE